MILKIESSECHVTVEVTAAGGVKNVAVDGRAVPIDWVRISNGRYSLILDGRVYDFIIDLTEDGCSVAGRKGSHTLQVEDARRLGLSHKVEGGQSGLQRLKAEMPGKVVRVLVKVGEAVDCDQGLLVLEAMKMQNEIRAPKKGIVRKIGVSPGVAVNTGEFLLSLE